jgi:hypothetical protein
MSTLTNPKPNTIGHNASPSLDFKQSLDLQEKVASEDPFDDTEVPDGGTQAWLVAAGAACIFFSCLGFANSFGVMQEYYMSHQLQGHSADKIAWIGSMSTFIQFAGGALAGPMFDRYGSWVCSYRTIKWYVLIHPLGYQTSSYYLCFRNYDD